jgi:hypothetical protein
MAIVYQHRRKDNNEIFYIGIGKNIKRAYHTKSRGKFWKDYTSKYQYEVEITHQNIIWEEACVIEKYLISFYGRRDLGLGTLVNMTDGGDGVIGHKHNQETKNKIGIASKKNLIGKKISHIVWNRGISLTDEHKRKISDNQKGRIPYNKNKSMSEEQKRKLSERTKKNPTNYWTGKKRSEETKEKIRQSLNKKNKI